MNVFVTGASGFLGGSLIQTLTSDFGRRFNCSANYRALVNVHDGVSVFHGGIFDINSVTLKRVGVLIHCAAYAHVMNDSSADPLTDFREVNTIATFNLAQQAVDAGVKRFIFVSTIKVNGETTSYSSPFQSSSNHSPKDPYGISKSEAELGLQKIARDTEMEVVIIRPPLIYGPGVKANFLNLLKLSATSLPLPFGLINNKRSMVYVENLVDLIVTCVDHPNAANKIFLASDGDDLSLARLLTLMRKSMGKPAWLLPVPMFMFKLAGMLTGKSDIVDRLIGDLQVDSSDAKTNLNWMPPYSVEQGIQATVDDFIANKNKR